VKVIGMMFKEEKYMQADLKNSIAQAAISLVMKKV